MRSLAPLILLTALATQSWSGHADARSRLIASANAEGGRRTFGYDHTTNVTSRSDARGHLTRFVHDAHNQLLSETGPILGRTAGALMEASQLVTAPVQLAADIGSAASGDADAQARMEQRAAGLKAFGQRMEQATLEYGTAGPIGQLAVDFAQGIGERATSPHF